jgi:hypothetical protein
MNKTHIYPTDGDWCAYLMGNYGDPNDGAWISQTLTETLTAETTYTLTVDVINDGVYNEDVQYKVQLLAGETVVAEDDDSHPLDPVPPGTSSDWATSTVVFAVGGESDPNFVYVGEPLGIRLVCKYASADIELSCDNVHLTADPPFAAPDLSSVELTVRVNDEANPTYILKDSMTIDVYSDDCEAAKAAGFGADNPGDLDEDCDTDIDDLVAAVETWLNDTSLTESVAKESVQTLLPVDGLIDDPGFEVPDQGDAGFEYNPSGAIWTFTDGSGLSGPDGPWACDSTSPDPLGDQFAYLQGAAAISQELTGLEIGATYELSFFESYRTGTSPENDLNVIIDEGLGTEVAIYNNPSVTNPTWEPRSTDMFYAAKDSCTLTFRTTHPLGDGDRSTLIDGVLIMYVPPVNAGDDMVTVSGLSVQLAPSFLDTYTPTSYLWSTDAPPSATVEAPTVTITPDVAGNPNTVTVTLLTNGSDEDSMEIEVYDDACLAAKVGMLELDPTDFDADCDTDIEDYAEMAEDWLYDYSLTEPAEKP